MICFSILNTVVVFEKIQKYTYFQTPTSIEKLWSWTKLHET